MATIWAERGRAKEAGEEWQYDARHGHNIMDDLIGWMPQWAFRVGAFPPACLTMSGAVALAVSVTFLLGAFMNIVEPHYARVQYSVQTRCQIMEIKEDEYIPHDLWHYTVKFPLPGIPGLRDGTLLCFASDHCAIFDIGSIHNCYFNTEDHQLNWTTQMSGHHQVRLFSYVVLMIPFLIGACCCLIPASAHWNAQVMEAREAIQKATDVEGMQKAWKDAEPTPQKQYRPQASVSYQGNNSYQGELNNMSTYQQARHTSYPSQQRSSYPSQQRSIPEQRGARGDGWREEPRGGGSGVSGVSWLRMQVGV